MITVFMSLNHDVLIQISERLNIKDWCNFRYSCKEINTLLDYQRGKRWSDFYTLKYGKQNVNNAIKQGNLEAVKYLLNPLYNWVCRCNSHLKFSYEVVWCETTSECVCIKKKVSVQAINLSACNGHIKVIRYLYEKGLRCSRYIVDRVALYGHLGVIKFLYEESGDKWCTAIAIDNASLGGHLEVVDYLYKNGMSCTVDAMTNASLKGHLHIVKYLHTNIDSKFVFGYFDYRKSMMVCKDYETREFLRQNDRCLDSLLVFIGLMLFVLMSLLDYQSRQR